MFSVAGGNVAIGGLPAGGGHATSVQRAPSDAAGNLGTFLTVSDVTLTVERGYLGLALLGNHLYALGGNGNTDALSSIERALLQ